MNRLTLQFVLGLAAALAGCQQPVASNMTYTRGAQLLAVMQIVVYTGAIMVLVVFVIMLFFMVMAGAVKVENHLISNLPGSVESDSVDFVDEVLQRR